MGFLSDTQLTENKLILLYIIDKINIPISNLQLMKIILDNKLMNYFIFQQFLKELCDSHLLIINETVVSSSTYLLTKAGKQTLEFFHNRIPLGLKSRLDSYMSSARKKIRNELCISADFIPENEQEYFVICKAKEDDFNLIDLKISVGTRNDANTICNNWKQHSEKIYIEIIESLLKNR